MRCRKDEEFLSPAFENAAVLLPCWDDASVDTVENVGVEDGPVVDAEGDILLTLDLGDVELFQAHFYED